MPPTLALLGVGLLIAGSTWVALRSVPMSTLSALPDRYRRRYRWWQLNARYVYVVCTVLVAGALLAALAPIAD